MSQATFNTPREWRGTAHPREIWRTQIEFRLAPQLLESATSQFEGVFGYEGNRVNEFEENVCKRDGHIRTATPTLNSGDLLIFDGLTFHRTFSHQNMNDHTQNLGIIVNDRDGMDKSNDRSLNLDEAIICKTN